MGADDDTKPLLDVGPILPKAPADLARGDYVGEYEVKGVLGRGGFGVVYEAVHPVIGKHVAIKVLNLRHSTDPQFVMRFIAEARAVNQIRHRHIIDIFSFGQLPDGRQYYVMELLRGETLAAHLASRRRLTPREALPLLDAVARALDAAHAVGIAHRDLKPDNVFVADDDGKPFPKLLDFGIAKLLLTESGAMPTATGSPVGTPPYMSPEQCRGHGVDHRTDVYSLGVMTYVMLTGRLPFTADNTTEIMWMHMSVAPRPPSELDVGLPAALDAPILHMLAKSPDQRPASAGEAIRALAAHVAALPVSEQVVSGAPAGELPFANTAVGVATPVGQSVRVTGTAKGPAAPPRRLRWQLIAASLALAGSAVGLGVVASRMSRDHKSELNSGEAAMMAAERSAADAAPPAPLRGPDPMPDAALSATVTLDVLGTPPNTEVRTDSGALLGRAPGRVTLPRGDQPLELSFVKAGYTTERRTITPANDVKLDVTLRKPRGKKPPKEEIPPW